MAHTQKRSTKRLSEKNGDDRILEPNDVEGLPPSDNLRKHADEAYGDTEIPHRRRISRKDYRESR
jgi:hypothetical protein